MRHSCVLAAAIVSAGACLVAAGEGNPPKAAAELPEIKGLSNPFAFSDGSLVRSKEDWQRRRDEIKRLFQDYEYGFTWAVPK